MKRSVHEIIVSMVQLLTGCKHSMMGNSAQSRKNMSVSIRVVHFELINEANEKKFISEVFS